MHCQKLECYEIFNSCFVVFINKIIIAFEHCIVYAHKCSHKLIILSKISYLYDLDLILYNINLLPWSVWESNHHYYFFDRNIIYWNANAQIIIFW